MEPNPYEAPAKSSGPPRARSIWPRVFSIGILLIAVGILAVVAAHWFAPARYAFVTIALTEKIVLLGLLATLIGGIGWAVRGLFP